VKYEQKPYTPDITPGEILEDIKRIAIDLHTNYVSQQEYARYGKYGLANVYARFKTWDELLAQVEFKFPGKIHGKTVSIEKLFENIENVWLRLGRQPKSPEMKKPLSKYHLSTYVLRFGTWKKAVKAYIEFKNKES
jgi:hypothetical protein